MRISDWSSDVCSSDLTPSGPLEGVCNGPEECRLATRQAIEAGVDSIEHGSFLQPDTLRLMKQKGVYLVPTRLALAWTVGHADGYPPKIPAQARAVALAIKPFPNQTVSPHGAPTSAQLLLGQLC